MARIRGKTSKRHRGVVQCSPEGCKFGSEPVVRCPGLDGETSPSDCFLQLRLRAGDAEDACGPVDVNELKQQIHECVDRMWKEEIERTITGGESREDRISQEVKLGKRSVNSARLELGYLEFKDEHPEDLTDPMDPRYPKRWKWDGEHYVVDEELSGRRDDSGEQPDNQEK